MTESSYERGTKAEGRIAKDIMALYKDEPHAEQLYEIEEVNGKNPDLMLTDASLGVVYQIECKTLSHPMRSGNSARAGYVKIAHQQIYTMKKIHNGHSISVLITEIRSAAPLGRAVIVVPWQRVMDKYKENEPMILSLGYWWLINNGVPLEVWWTALRNEPLFTEMKK